MRGDKVIYIIGMSMFQIRQNGSDGSLKGFQADNSDHPPSFSSGIPLVKI